MLPFRFEDGLSAVLDKKTMLERIAKFKKIDGVQALPGAHPVCDRVHDVFRRMCFWECVAFAILDFGFHLSDVHMSQLRFQSSSSWLAFPIYVGFHILYVGVFRHFCL